MWTFETHFSPPLCDPKQGQRKMCVWVCFAGERQRERDPRAHVYAISEYYSCMSAIWRLPESHRCSQFPVTAVTSPRCPHSHLSPFPLKELGEKVMYHVFYQISPPLLTFNLTDPLIGLLNEVQMIQDQTPSPLPPSQCALVCGQ